MRAIFFIHSLFGKSSEEKCRIGRKSSLVLPAKPFSLCPLVKWRRNEFLLSALWPLLPYLLSFSPLPSLLPSEAKKGDKEDPIATLNEIERKGLF